MGAARFAGQMIESHNPAVDVRALENGRLYIVGGKNYCFDSKGPKSGFGSRLVHGGAIGDQHEIQSVDLGPDTYILASKGIWKQDYASPATKDVMSPTTFWRKIATFDEERNDWVAPFSIGKLYSAYLDSNAFLCVYGRGLYRVRKRSAVKHEPVGIPDRPIAIAEVSGRLVVVNGSWISWSGPNNASDFTPALAGAGQQLLSDYMADDPIALTHTSTGCITWGEKSAMRSDFIGGDIVFQHSAVVTNLFPLGPMSITEETQNTYFVCTRQGIARLQDDKFDFSQFEEFNAFFREQLNEGWSTIVRLNYILEDDMLYIQLSDSTKMYTTTYVLSVRINRWGSFDEEHLGICRFGATRGATGYADRGGYVHRFTETADRQLPTGKLVGLDSWIEIGYFSHPELAPTADAIVEIQEIMISACESFPPEAKLERVDLMGVNSADTTPFRTANEVSPSAVVDLMDGQSIEYISIEDQLGSSFAAMQDETESASDDDEEITDLELIDDEDQSANAASESAIYFAGEDLNVEEEDTLGEDYNKHPNEVGDLDTGDGSTYEDWTGGIVFDEDWHTGYPVGDEDYTLDSSAADDRQLSYEETLPVTNPSEDWNDISLSLIEYVGFDFVAGIYTVDGPLYDRTEYSEVAPEDYGASNYLETEIPEVPEDYGALSAEDSVDRFYADGIYRPELENDAIVDLGEGDLDESVDLLQAKMSFVAAMEPITIVDEDDPTDLFIDTRIAGNRTYDLNQDLLEDLDMDGPYSLYNKLTYNIRLFGSMGTDRFDHEARLKKQRSRFNRDLWVGVSSGRFHLLRISATRRRQKYHVTQIDVSAIVQGEYS